MASFAISFRIAKEGNNGERLTSLVKKIQEEAADGVCWKETTSFYLIKSNKTAAALARDLNSGSLIDRSLDTLLVINVTGRPFIESGVVKHPATLQALLAPAASAQAPDSGKQPGKTATH